MDTLNKILALPIVQPLIGLLHSRAFLVAVATLVITSLEGQYPELKAYHDQITALALAIIAKMAVEDFATKRGNAGQG